MNSKVLITGSTGNVGYEVVRAYPDKSRLRCAVFDVEKETRLLGNEVEAVYFDFQKPETYAPAFKDVRAVFLMRPPQISNVKKYIAPAIDAAKEAGVEHIVFLSLVGVEKNPVVPHHKIEKYILQSGLDWTFLRASFFMQNLNTTHRAEIKDRSEIAVPAGKSKTSFIDVRDIGAVATKALSENGHCNKVYTLTGNEAIDYYEVADILSSVLGRKIKYTNPSAVRFVRQQVAEGRAFTFTLVMAALYTMTRMGTADLVSSHTSEILHRLPISFRQYAEDYRQNWLV